MRLLGISETLHRVSTNTAALHAAVQLALEAAEVMLYSDLVAFPLSCRRSFGPAPKAARSYMQRRPAQLGPECGQPRR